MAPPRKRCRRSSIRDLITSTDYLPNIHLSTDVEVASIYLPYEEMSPSLAHFPKAVREEKAERKEDRTCGFSTVWKSPIPRSGTSLFLASILTTTALPSPQSPVVAQELDKALHDFAGGDADRELEFELNTDMGMVWRATSSSNAYRPPRSPVVLIKSESPIAIGNQCWNCASGTSPNSQIIHESRHQEEVEDEEGDEWDNTWMVDMPLNFPCPKRSTNTIKHECPRPSTP